jgi:hypothetical protein
MDDTSSKGSAHGKESGADEQGAQAHLWRVTISSRRVFWPHLLQCMSPVLAQSGHPAVEADIAGDALTEPDL